MLNHVGVCTTLVLTYVTVEVRAPTHVIVCSPSPVIWWHNVFCNTVQQTSDTRIRIDLNKILL